MGKTTGFMDYERRDTASEAPGERIKHFNEFHRPLPLEERRRQAARCMECGVPFCQSGELLDGMLSGCPLNNLTPEWNDLLYQGLPELALERLLKTNSFPEFTSRVCPAPCEYACTCGLHGSPVSIRDNEKDIIENGFEHGIIKEGTPKTRTGKSVAVIGSGPSGLACADRLNRRGHSVTVYERSDRAGGLLMYGIPNMKLEKSVVERRVALMEREGVRFVTGAEVGVTESAQALMEEYDAVVLATGTGKPRDIAVPGRDASGIHFAVDYLKTNTKALLNGEKLPPEYDAKGKNVVIIGGGDTGNDCLGTAIRQGCVSALQIEMMPCLPSERPVNMPWPIWPRLLKTDYGQEEAIAVFGSDPRIYETTVQGFLKGENGAVYGAQLVGLRSERDAGTGRMSMVPVKGTERTADAELVIIAAGFLGTAPELAESFGLGLDGRGNLGAAGSFETGVPGVFTAGDAHRGQSLVVWAIREGRDAAAAVDKYLEGYTNL